MLYREIIAVCSQIHTKHINTLCGQNVEFANVSNTVAHQINTRLSWVNLQHQTVASGQHHAPTALPPTLPVRDSLNTTVGLHAVSSPCTSYNADCQVGRTAVWTLH